MNLSRAARSRVIASLALAAALLAGPACAPAATIELAAHKAKTPEFNIEQVHFFPLGGIKTNAQWVTDNGGASGVPANA